MLWISTVLGVLGFMGTRKLLSGVWARVSFALLPVLLVLGVYGGGRSYPYYFLIVAGMLLPPGMIALARLLSGIGGGLKRSKVRAKPQAPLPRRLSALLCAAIVAASVGYSWVHYQYRGFMNVSTAALAQTRFAGIMNSEEHPTLLNYGFLDGGFYTAADILPTEKYFCKLNVSLPEMTQAQDAAVQGGAVQFVVTRSDTMGNSKAKRLEENYERIAQARQEFEHRWFSYSLYKLRE